MKENITENEQVDDQKFNWVSGTGFILIHVACVLVFWAGFSWSALIALLVTYAVRMFGITAGYHRYFSHRTFKTSRFFQFILGWIGASSAQKGPLWWAANHRHHHKYSDKEEDIHSPRQSGFWWSHIGWILSDTYKETNLKYVKDLAKFPELKFLNKFHLIPPIVMAVFMFFLGWALQVYFPSLNTSGFQMLVWGFIVSTVMVYHGTFLVNSLTHVFGRKRFETDDDSRNSFLIALVTLGEGWHNNHHRFPSSERQGFYWWELDLSHYTLKVLSWFKIVWDLRTPPKRVYAKSKIKKPSDDLNNLLKR